MLLYLVCGSTSWGIVPMEFFRNHKTSGLDFDQQRVSVDAAEFCLSHYPQSYHLSLLPAQ
jgi:hypothetical protein